MPQGPYRRDAEAWVDPPAPRGIVFRGEDDRLRIEVRRYLPALVTASAVGSTVGTILAWAQSELAAVSFILAGAAYWLLPRFSRARLRTTIEIAGGRVTLGERGYLGQTEHSFALAEVGPPRVGEVTVGRRRYDLIGRRLSDLKLACLRFDYWVDGVPGGQSIPVDVLVGYPQRHLAWLSAAIADWRAHVEARKPRA